MAKVSAKKASEPKVKKVETPKATVATPKAAKEAVQSPKKIESPRKRASVKKIAIDTACEQAVIVLSKSGVESQLQSELAWCIGSYHHDQNPIGLIENGKRALSVLKALKAKDAKAVPAKVVTDLEKALNQA